MSKYSEELFGLIYNLIVEKFVSFIQANCNHLTIQKQNLRYKMPLGTVQEWYLTNSDPVSGHPIHIHVNHFQVSYKDIKLFQNCFNRL